MVPPEILRLRNECTFFIPQLVHKGDLSLNEVDLIMNHPGEVSGKIWSLFNVNVFTKLVLEEVKSMAKDDKHAMQEDLLGKNFYKYCGRGKTTIKYKLKDVIYLLNHEGKSFIIPEVIGLIGCRSDLALTSFLLCALINPSWPYIKQFLHVVELYKFNDAAAIHICKLSHTVVRKYGYWLDGPVTDETKCQIEYIQDLFSRNDYVIDFRDALCKRVVDLPSFRPDLWWDIDKTTFMRNMLKRILLPTSTLPKRTVEEFGDIAVMWAAKGSSPNTKAEVYLHEKRYRLQGTKKLWALHVDGKWLRYVLNHDPSRICSISAKYENGKNRELDNDCENVYAVQSYLLEGVEDKLGGKDGMLFKLGGPDALTFSMRQSALTQGAWVWSFDFSDFQLNHTLEDIIMTYEVLAELRTLSESGSNDDDYVKAAQFIRKAEEDTYLIDNQSGWMCKNKNGLITGSRGTAFINTVLNRLYFLTAVGLAKRLEPEGRVLSAAHMGDDIMCVIPSQKFGIALTYCMRLLGLTGQDLKIMLKPAEGELLRYLYCGGQKYGYINRSIPNLVAGEWDLAAREDPVAISRAIPAIIGKVVERGGPIHIMKKVERHLMQNHTKLYYNSGSGTPSKWNISPAEVCCSVLVGGAGVYTLTCGLPSRKFGVAFVDHGGVTPDLAIVKHLPSEGSYGLLRYLTNKGARNMSINVVHKINLTRVMTGLWPKPIVDSMLSNRPFSIEKQHTHEVYEPNQSVKRFSGHVIKEAVSNYRNYLISGDLPNLTMSYENCRGLWCRFMITDMQIFKYYVSLYETNELHKMIENLSREFNVGHDVVMIYKHLRNYQTENILTQIFYDSIPFDEVVPIWFHEDIRSTIRAIACHSLPLNHTYESIKDIQWLMRSIELALVKLL
jgi:hypothetical protein